MRLRLSLGRLGLVTVSLLTLSGLGAASCGGDGNGDGDGGSAGSAGGDADAGGAGGGGPSDSGPDVVTMPSTCGNGVVEGNEQCDEVSPGCDSECFWLCADDSVCSDGDFCNGREVCGADHTCQAGTPRANGTTCGEDRACQDGVCEISMAVCGDSLVNRTGGEECDDGDEDPANGCDNSCLFTCIPTTRECPPADPCLGNVECNGITHTCDAFPLADYTPCTLSSDPTATAACVNQVCTTNFCSNGVTDGAGEECDDGDKVTGDGCDFPSCRFSCDSTDAARNCAEPNPCKVSGGCDDATHTCNSSAELSDGTACGSGLICIAGHCMSGFCGDGIHDAATEECDDGNIVSDDGCEIDCAVSCGNPSRNCGVAPPCRMWTCTAGRCVDVPDASKNGQSCTTGAGTATCNAGACTAGTCGNGTLETGEQCDFGAENGPNTGCETSCTRSCTTSGDCTNGDGCDGNEACQDVTATNGGMGRRCVPGAAQSDGIVCGTDRICLSGVCRQSFCGDRYVDAAAVPAEQCDPPNLPFCNLDCTLGETCDLTGTWAEKVEVSVSWPAGFADAGNDVIEQWALLVITPVPGSPTEFTGSLQPCGTIIPDFTSTLAMGALFGLEFPNDMWDAANMPAFAVTGRVGNIVPGSSFEMDPFSLLLGLTMQDPFAPWPTVQSILDGTATGVTVVDHDSNARDGVSVLSKDDPEYTLPPVDLTNVNSIPQADILDLALRQITAASGTLITCDRVSGQVSITRVDTHVVGCRVGQVQGVPVTPRECSDTEVVTVNDGSPKYTATSATFVAERVSDTATCADVRALFPAIVR